MGTIDRGSRRRSEEPERAVWQWKGYLSPLHLILHATDAAVHCATHGPDSPQLWVQEKLLELQLEMHSENVWFCANRNLSINVAALPDVIPDIISKTTATYLMA